jgi:single-stranded DNA-binding protein
MAMETTGKLHIIFDTKQVSERFTKREFVVEMADNPKYPQMVLFQLTGDRCTQLDELRVGDAVRIEFSLRGREWRNPQGEVKYFNSLDVWKIEVAQSRQSRGRGQGGGQGGGYDDAPRGRGPAPGGFPAYDDAPPRSDEPRPRDESGRDGDDLPF